MKRCGRLGIVVCVILILLSAGLFVSAATGILDVNDKSPVSEVLKMGARLGLSRNEEDEIPKPIGRPREVGLYEPFVTHGVEITVQSIRIGKTRGDLPLMHPNDFVMRNPPKTERFSMTIFTSMLSLR